MAIFGVLLAFCTTPARASEPCDAGAGIEIAGAPALAFHDAYSPFDQTGLSEVITVTIANRSSATCDLVIVFTSDDGSGRLRGGGGDTLVYALETPGGTSVLRPASTIAPQAGAHVPLILPPAQAATISLRGRVPPRQVVAPGVYADGSARMRVYRRPLEGDFGALLAESSFPVAADVAAVCAMSEPQPGSIDFSDDIGANGRPEGATRTVQIPEAACNTAARLKLSGAPLTHDAATQLAGFDSFIRFEAQASFGPAQTTLTATQAGRTEEAASAPTYGAASAPVDVTLRLLAGRALVAGNYSAVLTLTLAPAP